MTLCAEHAKRVVAHLIELAVAGKSMLFHGVGFAVDADGILEGLAHGGEEYRGVAVPVGGIAVPHVFASPALQAQQFGPMRGDFYGYLVVFQYHTKIFHSY